jgi:hypothetical protein
MKILIALQIALVGSLTIHYIVRRFNGTLCISSLVNWGVLVMLTLLNYAQFKEKLKRGDKNKSPPRSHVSMQNTNHKSINQKSL